MGNTSREKLIADLCDLGLVLPSSEVCVYALAEAKAVALKIAMWTHLKNRRFIQFLLAIQRNYQM